MRDQRDFLSDPELCQDCTNCIYASGCTVIGTCPIGGPYYTVPDEDPECEGVSLFD